MDIATTLLEYGAKAETESKAGFTPLHLSSQEGHTDMTTLLLDHHADPNHKAKVISSFDSYKNMQKYLYFYKLVICDSEGNK